MRAVAATQHTETLKGQIDSRDPNVKAWFGNQRERRNDTQKFVKFSTKMRLIAMLELAHGLCLH